MKKKSRLLPIYLFLFAGLFMACEGEEENFSWTPGDELIINGPAATTTLTPTTYFVAGFTVDEDYTWTVDGETVQADEGTEGEQITVTFEEPGDHVVSVTNGTFTGDQAVVVASVPQEVAFAETALSVMEGDTLQIPVAISERNPSDTRVSFTISSANAVEGVDYEVLTPSPLEFESGVTGDTIQIRVLNDNILQGPRSLNLSLSAVEETGEGEREVTLAETAQEAEISFQEDVKEVSFANASDTLTLTSANDADLYTFEVELSEASDQQVTVNYEVVDNVDDPFIGPRTRGVEDLTEGTINFQPGQTSQPITLRIGDNAFENDRIIRIQLTSIESDDEEVMFAEAEDEEEPAPTIKVISIDVE